MSGPAQSQLHGLIRKESRSLLQYLSDAYPWTPAQEVPLRDEILASARRERDAIGDLVRYCVRHQLGYPSFGAYPEHFMDLNFVSLDSLLPTLLAEQKKRIAELEWSLLTVPVGAGELVRGLIEAKRRTLEVLAPTRTAEDGVKPVHS
jgi:hypothetical protein